MGGTPPGPNAPIEQQFAYAQKMQQQQQIFNTLSNVGSGLVQAGGQPQMPGQAYQNPFMTGIGAGLARSTPKATDPFEQMLRIAQVQSLQSTTAEKAAKAKREAEQEQAYRGITSPGTMSGYTPAPAMQTLEYDPSKPAQAQTLPYDPSQPATMTPAVDPWQRMGITQLPNTPAGQTYPGTGYRSSLPPEMARVLDLLDTDKRAAYIANMATEARKPPETQSQYDASGREQKVQWDRARQTWVPMGGVKSDLLSPEREAQDIRVAAAKANAEAAAKKKGEGTFAGTSMDAQDSNILLSGNPSSPEYALAYARQYETPKFVQTDKGFVPVMTPAPPEIRRPTARAASQANGPTAGGVIPGTEKEPTYTQDQSNAYTFSQRISQAEKVFTDLEKSGFTPGTSGRIVGGIPLVGNQLLDADRQQFNQAEENFINATLRRESGSAIGAQEFANARRQYIPQPGDSTEVLKQKKQNRETVLEGLRAASGRGRTKPSGSGILDYDPVTKTFTPRQ